MPKVSDSPPPMSPLLRGVLALLFLSTFLNYIDRSNLSIAAPLLKDELGISAVQLGWLLSAFFWTYASMQILAGWLVDRLDAKWVFAAGFALWSAATALTGILHSFVLLFVMRVILGIGESVAYPSYSKILVHLFHEHQRGLANSLIACGLAVGPGVGLLFGGVLMARYGWRPFFLVLGLASLLWLVPWVCWMPSASNNKLSLRPTPGYSEIMRQRSLWGTSLCLFCMNYSLYFMVTWLPFYLVRERGFTLPQMARVGAAYFFAVAISAAVAGRVSDRLIAVGKSPSNVRRGFMIGSGIAGGALLSSMAVAPRTEAVVLLIFAGLALGPGAANIWAITQRFTGPRAAGRWTGIQQFWGNMSGGVVSAVTGFLVERTGKFTSAIFLTAVVLWVGALSWKFFVGPVEPVQWSEAEPIEEFEPGVQTA